MLQYRFCPYCGEPIENGCNCLAEAAEAEREYIEELEERQLKDAWQDDIIEMYRRER